PRPAVDSDRGDPVVVAAGDMFLPLPRLHAEAVSPVIGIGVETGAVRRGPESPPSPLIAGFVSPGLSGIGSAAVPVKFLPLPGRRRRIRLVALVARPEELPPLPVLPAPVPGALAAIPLEF